MMNKINCIAPALLAGLVITGEVAAAPAEDAIRACRDAVEQSLGEDVLSRLTKIKSRGANYEVWLNLSGDQLEQRSYCYFRRGEVQQIVVEDGRWVGRNPRRPEGAAPG